MHPKERQFPVPSNEQMAGYSYDSALESNASQAMADNPAISPKDFSRKLDENLRETGTRDAARSETVEDLESSAKRGYPREISGDALARIKNDHLPKLHRD